MKKLLLTIFILLAFAGQGWGATYLWCKGSTGAFTEAAWNAATDCSGAEVEPPVANGDIYVANGQTVSIAASIGDVTHVVTLTTEGTNYGGTDGGGFTIDFGSVGVLTLYTNITAGSTVCLTISGAGSADPELTINGDIAGGTSTSAYGIMGSFTGAGTNVVVNGTVAGGSGTNTRGINVTGSTGSPKITVTGATSTGGSGTGAHGIYSAGTTVVMNGDCVGGSTLETFGCHNGAASATFTVVGNLLGSSRSPGDGSRISWTPGASNYERKIYNGTNYYYYGPIDKTKVELGTACIDKEDGATTGTLSTGGGAWGF